MYLEELSIKLAILSEKIKLEIFKNKNVKLLTLGFLPDPIKIELINLLTEIKNDDSD
jgi:hypothetical protein